MYNLNIFECTLSHALWPWFSSNASASRGREIGESHTQIFSLISPPREGHASCVTTLLNSISFKFITLSINFSSLPRFPVLIWIQFRVTIRTKILPIPIPSKWEKSFYEIFPKFTKFSPSLPCPWPTHVRRVNVKPRNITVINDSILIYTIKFFEKKTGSSRGTITRKSGGQPSAAWRFQKTRMAINFRPGRVDIIYYDMTLQLYTVFSMMVVVRWCTHKHKRIQGA